MARREDDRIAYLAGEDAHSLSAAERAELDEVRSLLESPATWAQPDPDLEDRVVAAIAEQDTEPTRDEPALAGPGRACICACCDRRMRSPASPRSWPRRSPWRCRWAAAPPLRRSSRWSYRARNSPRPPTATQRSRKRTRVGASRCRRAACPTWRTAATTRPGSRAQPACWFRSARSTTRRQVTLWAGVPPTQFPSLTVTRQQANGGPGLLRPARPQRDDRRITLSEARTPRCSATWRTRADACIADAPNGSRELRKALLAACGESRPLPASNRRRRSPTTVAAPPGRTVRRRVPYLPAAACIPRSGVHNT